MDFMYQSIPAVNIPPGDPREFANPFCPATGVLPTNLCPWGRGLDEVKFFPEMNENLLNIFIFGDVFKKPFRTGRKTLVFVYANCICLPEYLY